MKETHISVNCSDEFWKRKVKKIALNPWNGTWVYFVKIYDASNNLLNTKNIILQKLVSFL